MRCPGANETLDRFNDDPTLKITAIQLDAGDAAMYWSYTNAHPGFTSRRRPTLIVRRLRNNQYIGALVPIPTNIVEKGGLDDELFLISMLVCNARSIAECRRMVHGYPQVIRDGAEQIFRTAQKTLEYDLTLSDDVHNLVELKLLKQLDTPT
jgi:hypothetical protein